MKTLVYFSLNCQMVRELTNEVRRYIAMDEVELHSPYSSGAELSDKSAFGLPLNEKVTAFERQLIADILTGVDGNRVKASEQLQVPLATLYRKIQKHGL